VGYGDVAPVTLAGRLLAGFIALLGVAIFALPAGILGSGFMEHVQRRRSQAHGTCHECGARIGTGSPSPEATRRALVLRRSPSCRPRANGGGAALSRNRG
jgi:voltage-gated potassium channel